MPVLKFNYFKACHQYCQFHQHALRCMACSDFQLWSHMIKGESLLLLGVFQSSLKEKVFCLLKEQGTQNRKYPKVTLFVTPSKVMLTPGLAEAKQFCFEHRHWQEVYI